MWYPEPVAMCGPSVQTPAERSPLSIPEIWLLAQGSILCIPTLGSLGLGSAAATWGKALSSPPPRPAHPQGGFLGDAERRQEGPGGGECLDAQGGWIPKGILPFALITCYLKNFLNQWHSTSKKDLLGRSKRSSRKVIISE